MAPGCLHFMEIKFMTFLRPIYDQFVTIQVVFLRVIEAVLPCYRVPTEIFFPVSVLFLYKFLEITFSVVFFLCISHRFFT